MPTPTADMIDAFYSQGFCHIPAVFNAAEMDAIDAAAERLHALAVEASSGPREGSTLLFNGSRITFGADGRAVRHIAFSGNAEPALLRFGRHPRILEIAAAILNVGEFDHLINQVHYKRPGSAVVFDWHQDSQHRNVAGGGFVDVDGRGSYVQIALAIDDATAENGPLEFIPGSNKLGHLGADLPNRVDLSQRVAPMIKRGDVAAFGPFTVHGSEANRSQKSRRVFINGFAYPGANQRDYGLPHSGERVTYSPQV